MSLLRVVCFSCGGVSCGGVTACACLLCPVTAELGMQPSHQLPRSTATVHACSSMIPLLMLLAIPNPAPACACLVSHWPAYAPSATSSLKPLQAQTAPVASMPPSALAIVCAWSGQHGTLACAVPSVSEARASAAGDGALLPVSLAAHQPCCPIALLPISLLLPMRPAVP